MWDSPTMSTSTVDSKKRIVLPGSRPGDVFDIQQQREGRFLLVRLEKPERTERLSKEACIEAMRNAPLRPTMAWEQLRKLTREP
jgi:bifunctional DNA-binding transcriptional regulator/antitoxin component of YhaV-PrlF toxin-antitoxin module